MKVSLSIAAVAILAATAIALPSHGHDDNDDNSSPAGAIYVMTNEPSGNVVLTYDISKDGTVSFAGGKSTGGIGAHAIDAPAPVGEDGLFSQGSIAVLDNNLFVVNSGSNTLSMFSIDPSQPSHLNLIGKPAGTGGEFPVSVAVSKQSGNVCVLNGGSSNGVQCFIADEKRGLRAIPQSQRSLNVNQTTPPSGPPNSLSSIIFSEDGSKLFAAVKGVPPQPGFIATWVVQHDGSLSKNFVKSVPAGGALPFSMTPIPGTSALLNTDPGLGYNIFDFGKGDVASSKSYPVAGQTAICWSVMSRQTGTYFIIDTGAVITELAIDRNLNPSIIKQYQQTKGSSTIDSAVGTVNGHDYLYVLAAGVTSIDVLSLNKPGGAKNVQTYDFSNAAEKTGVRVTDTNLQGMAIFMK